MAKRTDQGIISIGADGMSYSDNENYKTIGVSGFLVLCMKSCMNGFRITRIAWRKSINFLHGKRFFDEIGGTYERVWSKEELDQGYLNN